LVPGKEEMSEQEFRDITNNVTARLRLGQTFDIMVTHDVPSASLPELDDHDLFPLSRATGSGSATWSTWPTPVSCSTAISTTVMTVTFTWRTAGRCASRA